MLLDATVGDAKQLCSTGARSGVTPKPSDPASPAGRDATTSDPGERAGRLIPQEMRISEAHLAGIISLATDAIVSVDADYRIILFNTGAERIFGYTADEIHGQPLNVLIPEKYRSRHNGHLAMFAASPVAARRMGERNAIFGRRKNGEIFPAEAAISKIEVDGARYFTAVLRDISAQVEAEAERERLLAHAERARTMAEVAQARAQDAERRARFLADASVVVDSSLEYAETLRSIARLVVPQMAAFAIIDVLDDQDAMRRLDVVHRDENKQEIARRLRDFPLDWSRPNSAQRARETLQPQHVPEVTPDILANWAQSPEHLSLWRALAPTSYIVVPMIARGRLLGTIGLGLDDPSRRYSADDVRLADELARRVAIAVDNARLYAAAQRATHLRNEILGVVSHDLRNPLSVIAMCGARLAGEDDLDRAGAADIGETIQEAAAWTQRLVSDLLDIASIEAGKLSVRKRRHDPVIIAAKSAVAFEHLAAEREIEVEVITPDTVPPVDVDEQRIIQVLSNMIGNALKFTNRGGRVSVEVAHRGSAVLFSVRDTGSGIPVQHLPRVFDRFWQADERASIRGSGLGLSIAKGIIDAHGGRIWVESAVGAGSTFYFTIPVA
jgi:PAS domain S-box-containing protein